MHNSGQHGTRGSSGYNAGNFEAIVWRDPATGGGLAQGLGVTVAFDLTGPVAVRARGGDGGNGGGGSTGHEGRHGAHGGSGQHGGRGGAGGPGGDGGDAGNGGSGGHITIKANPQQADVLLTVVSNVEGGRGGVGGPGGAGGRGGRGGPAGCRMEGHPTPHNGSSGPNGPSGRPGRPGVNGAHGSVQYDLGGVLYPAPFDIRITGFGNVFPQHTFLEPGAEWYGINGVTVANTNSMPLPQLESPFLVGVGVCDELHFDVASGIYVPPLQGISQVDLQGELRFQVRAVDEDFIVPNVLYRKPLCIPYSLQMPGLRRVTTTASQVPHTLGFPLQMWAHFGEQVPGNVSHGTLLPNRPVPLRLRLRSHGGHRMNERRAKLRVKVVYKHPMPGQDPSVPAVLIDEFGVTHNTQGGFECAVDSLPQEGAHTDFAYTIQLGPDVPAYTPVIVHTSLLLEHALTENLFQIIQVNTFEVAVAEELHFGETWKPGVLLVVTKATPAQRIALWREALQTHGQQVVLYDATLYNGLRCGQTLRSIAGRVSTDTDAPDVSIGELMVGRTVVFFDDMVTSIADASGGEESALHRISAKQLLTSEADFTALAGCGLLVLGGVADERSEVPMLKVGISFPSETAKCFPMRGYADAPTPNSAKKIGAQLTHFLKTAGQGIINQEKEVAFHLKNVKESFCSCCISGDAPERSEYEKLAKKVVQSLMLEFPEKRAFVGIKHNPGGVDHDTTCCFMKLFKKQYILGDLFVIISPQPRIIHKVWTSDAQRANHEDFTDAATTPVLFDALALLSLEEKLAKIAEGVAVATYIHAITAELVRETKFYYDANGRADAKACVHSKLFKAFSLIAGAGLPVDILTGIFAGYEHMVNLMHAEAAFMTRFRSLSAMITKRIEAIVAASGGKSSYAKRVEEEAKEGGAKKKRSLDVVMTALLEMPDAWRVRNEVGEWSTLSELSSGKTQRVSL